MSFLYYLSYAAVLAAFAFVTLSLASGLLYVSELIEEHSRLSKIIGQRGIYAIIVLHGVLYVTESLPFMQTIFSIFCHLVYLQNFSHTWPVISLSSVSFIASCGLVIVDHFLWFFYFSRITHDARHRTYRSPAYPRVPGFTEIATFFGICVWLAPLFLFLSLSANDNALPTAEPSSPASLSHPPPSRESLFRSVFSSFSFSVRPRASRKDTSEGLIAPRSPRSPIPLPLPSPSLTSMHSMTPPRSPGPRLHDADASSRVKGTSNFTLGTPPRRSAQSIRRNTTDNSALGLRKLSSSSSHLGYDISRDD